MVSAESLVVSRVREQAHPGHHWKNEERALTVTIQKAAPAEASMYSAISFWTNILR